MRVSWRRAGSGSSRRTPPTTARRAVKDTAQALGLRATWLAERRRTQRSRPLLPPREPMAPPRSRRPYITAHGLKQKTAMNGLGLTNAYNLVNGRVRTGFTRLSGTVHTRIDGIYTPTSCSNVNWQKLGPHSALFTGKGDSDHLPVIGTFEIAGHRSGRTYDVRINSELFDSQDVSKVISHLWRSHIRPETPDSEVEETWLYAQRAAATYLLWATKKSS